MTPLITTGVSGLVGSGFFSLYREKYSLQNLDISDPQQPVDITDRESVFSAFENSPAEAVIHLAAFTDVSRAWEERDNREGIVYKVNVIGTENIIAACEKFSKHLIYVSTAYVFDGEKKELYTEDDSPNPIEWYGQTKYEGELRVQHASCPWTILRIDQPFALKKPARPDVVRRLITNLQAGTLPPQFSNHFFGPTVIEDFACVLDWVLTTNTTGLFHASSGEQWSDYDFAKRLQQLQSLPGTVTAGDIAAYLATVARPYQRNTAMDVSKLTAQLPFSLLSIENALQSLKV